MGSVVVKAAAMLEMLAAPACSKVCSQLFCCGAAVPQKIGSKRRGVMPVAADSGKRGTPDPCSVYVGGVSW